MIPQKERRVFYEIPFRREKAVKNRFAALACMTVEPIRGAICAHPFVVELVDGTLPGGKFAYALQQDRLRLVTFGRALALVGAKMYSHNDVALGLYLAEQGLLAEQELYEYYFKEFQITPDNIKSPSCFGYSSHMLERAALGSPAEAMAALLPCFWLFRELGEHVRKLADSDNPYFKWAERYSGEVYSIVVDKACALTDHLAAEAGDEERQGMLNIFLASCRYEYGLKEDAYTLKTWPVM